LILLVITAILHQTLDRYFKRHPTLPHKSFTTLQDNFYQCFENRSITAFFEPGKECLRTDSAPPGCVAVGVYDSWSMDAFTKEFGEALFFGHSSGVRSRHDASSSSTNSSRALEYMSHNLAHEASVEERCHTLRCWWNLTPELQALVTQARADISALSGQRHRRRPMVAIQARGGDKAAEEVLAGDVLDPKTHQYAMGYGMKRLKLAHPGLEGPTCIIVGDADGSYVSSLIHQANDILNCSSVVVRTGGKGPWGLVGHQGLRPNATAGRGHHQSSFNGLPLEQRCNATKQFIVDLEVMGWADFLVSNEKSNVAEVAYLLRCGMALVHYIHICSRGGVIRERSEDWFHRTILY